MLPMPSDMLVPAVIDVVAVIEVPDDNAPAVDRFAPTATFPLESLTMLLVDPDGWMTVTVLIVDIITPQR